MKMRFVWLLVIGMMAVIWGAEEAFADGLQWQIPGGLGTIQLPTGAADILPLAGYDFIQKQFITGASASLLTLLKEINGYAGAVGEFQTQAPNIQPYMAIGADVAKYIPGLKEIQNLQIQGFARYVMSNNQHLGAGAAIAWKFWGPTGVTAPTISPASTTPAS